MKKLLLLFSFILTIHFAFAEYDPLQGLEYAYASSLSYCNPPHIQSWECGQACQNLTGYQPYYTYLVQVATAQSLSFSMIYNPSSKRFVTAFRGTVGNIELLSEILEDTPVAYELSNITDAKVLKYFYNHYTGLRANFTQKLQEFYVANSDYNFIFTGHSLGAALSSLAAFDTVTSGSIPADKVSLYNYGSPRVGNYAFAQAVKAAIPVIYRTTHWNDLVPHVPPCVTNSSGSCVPSSLDAEEMQDSGILWPAWHISPEVFYDKASYSYKICVESEDQNCTDQFKLLGTNMLEHYHYMNVSMECDGNMAVQSFASLGEKATEEMLFETMFIRW